MNDPSSRTDIRSRVLLQRQLRIRLVGTPVPMTTWRFVLCRATPTIVVGMALTVLVGWIISGMIGENSASLAPLTPSTGDALVAPPTHAFLEPESLTTLRILRIKPRTGFEVLGTFFGAPTRPRDPSVYSGALLRPWSEVVPPWSVANQQPEYSQFPTGTFAIVEEASGWPCRAMYGRRELHALGGLRDVAERESWALAVPGTTRTRAGTGAINVPWLLPLRPIWPGFAINTAFYATCYLLVILPLGAALRAAARQRRRRRGICIHRRCGYPIAGLHTCPECGKVQLRTRPPPDPSTP